MSSLISPDDVNSIVAQTDVSPTHSGQLTGVTFTSTLYIPGSVTASEGGERRLNLVQLYCMSELPTINSGEEKTVLWS